MQNVGSPPGGLEPPTFRLTAERASQLRHGGRMHSPTFPRVKRYFFHEVLLGSLVGASTALLTASPAWSSG